MYTVPIVNQTLELVDCRDKWSFDETYGCWCLEDILYTLKATTPKFQRMSIFVPRAYLDEAGNVLPDGTCGAFTAKTAPVLFENNAAGYMQMPHTWLGGPRDEGPKYLARGMVFVTCGSRGRESVDGEGRLCAKSPWTLIDLKTAIRFLRHNAGVLPGDFDRMISVGWSAGGAMSALIGVTGNAPQYDVFLEANGAFMDERDDVYASQDYCPIIDLEHADLAYEWQFQKDPENEASIAGPAGTMTPFQSALSKKLADRYVTYFNGLGLKDPETGSPLTFGEDGRSGSAYDYLMSLLNASAGKYLAKLENSELPEQFSAADYLSGNYTYLKPGPLPMPGAPGQDGKDDLGLHHAGAAVMLPPAGEKEDTDGPTEPFCMGDLLLRPPKGVPYVGMEPPMIETEGMDKRAWLSWQDGKAEIADLDTYLLNHRRRMKPCTSFDTLNGDSGENQEFGTPEQDYLHFDLDAAAAIEELAEEFPEEYAQYYPGFAAAKGDPALAKRKALINPMLYVGDSSCTAAAHFRIRVGAQDADTAFTISMAFALKLANAGIDTDYALVWDKPHCEADYPGEVCDWIESIM